MGDKKILTEDELDKVAGGQSMENNGGGGFGETKPVNDGRVFCPTCGEYVEYYYVLSPTPDNPNRKFMYCWAGPHKIQ